MKRDGVVVLEFLIESMAFWARFSLKSSRDKKSSFSKVNKSAMSEIKLFSSSCVTTFGPRPSISSAVLEMKWKKLCCSTAKQLGFVQRYAASPSTLSTGESQTGQDFGNLNFSSEPVRMFGKTSTTSGMMSPAFWMITVSPMRISLRLISSSLWRVARETVVFATSVGVRTATGVSVPVRPTEIMMSSILAVACSAGNLKAAA